MLLYLVTDRRLLAGGAELAAFLRDALAGAPARGDVGVQLREKDLDEPALWRLAHAVRAVCAELGAPFYVNGRLDVALALAADGVHLPSDAVPVGHARTTLRELGAPEAGEPGAIRIARSTHTPQEVAAAAAAGADFVVFGPVWPTPSKAALGAPAGLAGLHDAAQAAAGRLPVYALGGLTTPAEVTAAIGAGASGAAVIRAVFEARDPAAAVHALARAARPAQPSSRRYTCAANG